MPPGPSHSFPVGRTLERWRRRPRAGRYWRCQSLLFIPSLKQKCVLAYTVGALQTVLVTMATTLTQQGCYHDYNTGMVWSYPPPWCVGVAWSCPFPVCGRGLVLPPSQCAGVAWSCPLPSVQAWPGPAPSPVCGRGLVLPPPQCAGVAWSCPLPSVRAWPGPAPSPVCGCGLVLPPPQCAGVAWSCPLPSVWAWPGPAPSPVCGRGLVLPPPQCVGVAWSCPHPLCALTGVLFAHKEMAGHLVNGGTKTVNAIARQKALLDVADSRRGNQVGVDGGLSVLLPREFQEIISLTLGHLVEVSPHQDHRTASRTDLGQTAASSQCTTHRTPQPPLPPRPTH